jgi:RecA/RadA recombinase
MDTSYFFVREGTNPTEYQAGQKVVIDKDTIDVNKEEGIVSGTPAKGHGSGYAPWFSFKEGIAGCSCTSFEEGEVVYCRHIIGLFLALDKRKEKYAEDFFEARDKNVLFTSFKAESGVIPTGCETIDNMLFGGWPRGVVTLLAGPTKGGKTFLSTQTTFKSAFDGLNVLFVDTENMIRRTHALLSAQEIFGRRFGADIGELMEAQKVHPNIHPLPQHNLYDIAKIFGVYIYIPKGTDRKLIPIIKKEYNKYSDIPAYRICKDRKIDLVVFDGLTELFKSGGVTTSQTQNLIGRGEIINMLFESFEGIAGELDLAFLMTSHVSRDNRYFNLYEDILDKKVTEKNAGVWGGSSLMYNVKHFVQIEDCTLDWAKGRDIKHVLRRLYPFRRSTHVDVEFVDDFGFADITF